MRLFESELRVMEVLWSEGVDKANEFLAARKLDPLTI